MNDFTTTDYEYMARALRLAERGLYTTDPNPRVGCVLVRGQRIVGEGWHQRAGDRHAEVHALATAGDSARGATAYVNLEPCSHYGRTPPCVEALVEAGVSRVVAAAIDPNPQVAGQGLRRLAQAGVDTAQGLMRAASEALNPGFFKRMRQGMPWVRCKLAMSLDGRTAMVSGESRWITAAAARRDVHRLRARSGALLTGAGTVVADDPRLTVRGIEESFSPPRRVVLDSRLRTPPQSRLVADGNGVTLLYSQAQATRIHRLEAAGAQLWRMPADVAGRVEPAHALAALAREEINEVMVEAGPTLSGALLQAGLVDELVVYMAPHLIGHEGQPLLRLGGLGDMAQCLPLTITDLRQIGDDVRLTMRLTA